MARLASQAVIIRTGRRQKLLLECETGELVYVVKSGMLILHAEPSTRRQILGILYPGDIFRSSLMPPLPAAGATALTGAGEIWRLRWPAFQAMAESDDSIAGELCRSLTDQASRYLAHSGRLGSLSGDERVASLLVELAGRIGSPSPSGGVSFEMPLSRADIADYLALNADTVSRIMSRLRGKGLLARAGRGRLQCRDLQELAAECPLSGPIAAMHLRSVRNPARA